MFKKSKSKFPTFRQLDRMDCGPSCLKIISKYYGKDLSFESIKDSSYLSKKGVTLQGIMDAAKNIGLNTKPFRVSNESLRNDITLPCIIHWKKNHFMVLYKIENDWVYVSDPEKGLRKLKCDYFLQHWLNKDDSKGIALTLVPSEIFYELPDEPLIKSKNIWFLKPYFKPYKGQIIKLILALLVTSAIQLCLPFLTQELVDRGINDKDIGFVYLILIGQIFFFIILAGLSIFRKWVILKMTTRININLISDFLKKLLKKNVSYFQTKQTGDLIQRINDHKRIESFISSKSLSTIFGLVNIIVFMVVLAYYKIEILIIFTIGTVCHIAWTMFFMSKRAHIDIQRFEENSKNQSSLIEILSSIIEIKINGSERKHRLNWTNIQNNLFAIKLSGFGLEIKQVQGAQFINNIKNTIIIFVAAKAVIDDHITLGAMLAIQFIVGSIEAPILQLMSFILKLQEANLSIQRLAEIHEESNSLENKKYITNQIEWDGNLELNGLSFRYGSPSEDLILSDLNLVIPNGKVTSIVGPSGSGKTTLLKLLLKLHNPSLGHIKIGNDNFNSIDEDVWRRECGVVMQDGFIFNDTIKNNIIESNTESEFDEKLFDEAIKISNIENLISILPEGIHTKIGKDGNLLSGGEKQRILIARAVYKNPKFLFFDEATSALDANNERIIVDRLTEYYKNKTVIIIAHRLSTVKKSDQIVVINKGMAIETGTHKDLVNQEGYYYHLVKNQL